MKITIEFRTDNAAFEDNPTEAFHVLESAQRWIQAEWITEDDWEHLIFDSNGNSVGTVRGELDE